MNLINELPEPNKFFNQYPNILFLYHSIHDLSTFVRTKKKKRGTKSLCKPVLNRVLRERSRERKREIDIMRRNDWLNRLISEAVALLIVASFFFFLFLFFFPPHSSCRFQGEGVGSEEMVAQSGTAHRVFPLRWRPGKRALFY